MRIPDLPTPCGIHRRSNGKPLNIETMEVTDSSSFIIDYEAADCWGVGKVQKWSDSDFFWWNLEVEPPL